MKFSLSSPALPGLILLLCAAVAVVLANSPLSEAYGALLHAKTLGLSTELWINDGLMAIFFFVVGLEIRREMIAGELSTIKKASLPVAGALGGMLAPALVFLLFTAGTEASRGWGIPMATDIAFSLGVLSLAGPVLPALRTFLQALAVVDDLGAVLVIAFFYTQGVSIPALGGAAAIWAALAALNRLGVKNRAAFLVPGLALWGFTFASGVHPTIAGVALAFVMPRDSLEPVEHALKPWMDFAVMPLFALANAGVSFAGGGGLSWAHPVTLGIAAGLVAGKQLGITLVSWLSVRLGYSELPKGATWRQLSGLAWLGGIGFTMSLFIATLAFRDEQLLSQAKLGILSASALSGCLALLFLRRGRS